ncbi:hypothetical protein ES703_81170 [subsurface metagenome]
MNKIFIDSLLNKDKNSLFSSIFISLIIVYLCATELIFYPIWVSIILIFFFICTLYYELKTSYYFIFGILFFSLSFIFLILAITNIWLRFLISSLPFFIFGLINPYILPFKNRIENKFGKNIIKSFFIFILLFAIIISILFISHQLEDINLSKKYYSEGYNFYQKNDFISAIDSLEKSVKLDIKNYEALNLLGRAYLKEKDFENSKKFLIKAVKIKPDYFYATVALATAFEKSEDFENAIKYYKEAQKLEEGDFGAHFGMGRTLYKKGDLDKAFEKLITVNIMYPKKFEVHYLLGKIYYEKEEYEKALNQFNICKQLKKPEEFEIPEGEEVMDFIEKIKINMKK